jgi:RNA polymerase sigma-70 factor (ECF subfamily)
MTNGQTMHTLPGSSQFPTTRWTLVVADSDPNRKEARSALVALCENYWYPLYAYLRRRGHPADQAQDLTQEFFTRLLEGRYLDRADPEKGRFRSFLLTSLKFFVADEEDRQRAHKRGGGHLVSLEFSSGEERYQREPAHDETPERIFDRRWALSVLDRVVEKLRDEFVQHGRPEHFERLKVFLLGQSDAPYATLAREMNTSEGALKVAIHRLRKRSRLRGCQATKTGCRSTVEVWLMDAGEAPERQRHNLAGSAWKRGIYRVPFCSAQLPFIRASPEPVAERICHRSYQ